MDGKVSVVALSVCLSVCLPVCLSVCLSALPLRQVRRRRLRNDNARPHSASRAELLEQRRAVSLRKPARDESECE